MRIALITSLLATASVMLAGQKYVFPDPAVDMPKSEGLQTAVVAGGCFWGIEGLYEHVKGVKEAVSGFAGGEKKTAHYDMVSEGNTGHAESVQITFDPNQITYGQILKVFFEVGHNPTEKNYQGPDHGTQYRSAIFYANDDQKKVAEAYIKQLNEASIYGRPIVTEVAPLKGFYPAEAYHQHFMQLNPTYPYIVYNDMPKLAALKKELPELCKR